MKRFLSAVVLGFASWAGAATTDSVQVYTTQHFAIYWIATGPNAPVARDADGNGRPDYIDTAAKDLEATYHVLADSLHYRVPRGQTTTIHTRRQVPSGLYPVEILDLATADSKWQGTRMYGCIHDSSESPDHSPGTQLWLENDFLDHGTDSIWVAIRGVIYRNWVKEPYTALKFAVAHELYHAFTYEYDYTWTYAFHEMAAVWFESWYAPETQNHWRYLPLFRDNLLRGAFDNYNQQGYGNFLYLKAMVDLYGVDVIRKLWEDRAAIGAGNDDAAWFKAAWKRLKIDTISNLTKYYGTNAVKLITGQSGTFDDGGALVRKINPTIPTFTLSASDTTELNSWTASIGAYAIRPFEILKSGLPGSFSRLMVYSAFPEFGGNLYAIHMPSRVMESFDVLPNNYTEAFSTSDTSMIFIDVTGEDGSSWGYYGTTRTSSLQSRLRLARPIFTRSTDILGRATSSSGPSQVRIDLTATTDGTRRRFGR